MWVCKLILDVFRKLKFKKVCDEYVDKGIGVFYLLYEYSGLLDWWVI